MNVGDLKKMLEQYPDDMEILTSRCSDYEIVAEKEWSVVKGVDTNSGWIMRSHPTMSDENKSKEKSYLYVEGN